MLRDTDTGVGDRQHDGVAEQSAAHHYLAAVGREFHGIGQQVDQDLLGRAAVRHHANRLLDVGVDHQMLVVGATRHHAQRFGERLGQIERLHVELHPSGLDLGHVEDVVDDFQQIVAAGENVVAVFLIFLRAELAEHAAFHDLGETDDGVERRAQLVTHIGQELGFGLVGLLGAGLFPGVFLGEIGELDCLSFERSLRAFQVNDGGA